MNCEIPASDLTLVSEILGGQRERFQELVQKHQKMVYGVAWSQLGNADLAEEAAQQTFVKAYCCLATLRDTSKFKGWLATIARNVSVSLGRTRRRELSNSLRWEIEPAEKINSGSEERANLTDELRMTLANLPEAHRQVLTLFYLEDQSIKKVAAALDVSEAAVKTRLNRARNLLRQELERRLADSLSELAPANSLALAIMANLPAGSPFAAAAKLTLIGKTTGVIGKSLSYFGAQIGLLCVSMIPSWFILSWHSKQVAGNFQLGKENDFRRELTLGHPVSYLLLLLGTAIIVQALYSGFGLQASFLVISTFCLYGIWTGLRGLRVHDTPRARAMIGCGLLQFFAYLSIGVFEMPFQWLVVILFATILFMNVIMQRFRQTEPSRKDYNLFLRAATGGIAAAEETSSPTGQHEDSALNLEPSQLVGFARFLGKHSLVSDYKSRSQSIRLDFPPAHPSALNSLFRWPGSKSSVVVHCNGQCELYFSRSDQAAVSQLSAGPAGPEKLTGMLKRAIESCVADYASGDHESALQKVKTIDDAKIFKDQPETAAADKRRSRILFALAITATVIWALILLL